MTNGIDAITTQALAAALDASALRHQVLALNIANANAENYVPQRVSFEAQVQDAIQDLESRGSIDPKTLTTSSVRIEPMLDPQGRPQPVRLDDEMVEVARNSIHYQALVKGLSRHMAILSTAAGDGRK